MHPGHRRNPLVPRAGNGHAAALSPAGDAVVTLTTTTSGLAAVDLTTLSGPERRRLWSVPGGWTAESTISWAPDGSLIAATYNSEDDEWATVILDADGGVVMHLPETITLPGPNGVWLDNRRLLCVDDALDLFLEDVRGFTRTPMAHRGAVPYALVHGELVTRVETTPDGDTIWSRGGWSTHLMLSSSASAAFPDCAPRPSRPRVRRLAR